MKSKGNKKPIKKEENEIIKKIEEMKKENPFFKFAFNLILI